MSKAPTPWGATLLDLTARLTEIQQDDELVGPEWVGTVLETFVATPLLQDLDPLMYDALLAWAGFDLHNLEGLHHAATVTAFLVATGVVTFCEDDECDASGVIQLAASDLFAEQRDAAATYIDSEEAEELFGLALKRSGDYWLAYVRDHFPGGQAEAA